MLHATPPPDDTRIATLRCATFDECRHAKFHEYFYELLLRHYFMPKVIHTSRLPAPRMTISGCGIVVGLAFRETALYRGCLYYIAASLADRCGISATARDAHSGAAYSNISPPHWRIRQRAISFDRDEDIEILQLDYLRLSLAALCLSNYRRPVSHSGAPSPLCTARQLRSGIIRRFPAPAPQRTTLSTAYIARHAIKRCSPPPLQRASYRRPYPSPPPPPRLPL